MKIRHALALFAVACIPLCATAATRNDDPAVQELIALEEKWIEAENAHDSETLRTILDERFIAISDGGVSSREEFIANITKGPVDPTQTQTLIDRTFLIDGDTAVVTEIDHVQRMRDGTSADFAIRCTTTYIRRDGRWRALAEVFNKVPPPK